jgi:uncharacterized C2H2 Zn-finger protein
MTCPECGKWYKHDDKFETHLIQQHRYIHAMAEIAIKKEKKK